MLSRLGNPFQLLVLVFSLLSCVYGQISTLPPTSDDYVIKTWSVDEGLPESSPTCIAQTSDGYLWIGTWNGLARFDGLRFASFHSGNTPAFRVSRISGLHVDRAGTLWIGTGGGGLIEYKDGQFRRFGAESGLTNLFVNGCVQDANGVLWVGTDGGLFKKEKDRFEPVGSEVPLLSGTLLHLFADSVGRVYINAQGSALCASLSGGVFRVLRTFVGGQVILDALDRVWYWDDASVLRRLEGDREISFFQFKRFRHTSTWALRNGAIGICFLDRIALIRNDRITELPFVGDTRIHASETVFEDQENNLWLGRASTGLARIRRKSLNVLSTSSGLSSEIVTSIVEDGRGILWVGTYRQGLNFLKDGLFERYYGTAITPTGTVDLLWRDRRNTVWVGSHLRGLVRIGRVDGDPYVRGIVTPRTNVMAMDRDRGGVRWIGTANDGVQRDSAGLLSIWNVSSGLSANDISTLLCARDGTTWVGTSSAGVNRIHGETVQQFRMTGGLTSDEVRSLLEDEEGGIWIGTRRGLNRWKKGVLRGLTERDGLADETIALMIDDGLGNYWFGGTKGIFRTGKQDLHRLAEGSTSWVQCRIFGTEDGLVVSEVGGGGTPRAWRDRAGILWFASERGLIRVDPRSIDANPVPPPVIIEEIQIDHRPVSVSRPVVLQPEDSRVEFVYTGISFRSPGNVRFRYRMEGLEEDWQDGGTRRFAQYTNLPSGNFSFHITAANSDGIWNTVGASVSLIVLPPFYDTGWFITLVILFFLTSGPTVYALRVRSLKREQQRHKEFGRKLIERQEEERRRISRDMHDSLGQELLVLKHRIQSRLRKKKGGKETTSMLNELSETVSGTISLVRHISHNLRPPELDRLGLTETLKAVLERVRTSKVFDIRGVVDDVDRCFEKEDEINVVRIVQEALNNVIKHANATAVEISVTQFDRYVELVIQDNGMGMRRPVGTAAGIGVTDIHERAGLMGGSCAYEVPKEGGTIVRVRLPKRDIRE